MLDADEWYVGGDFDMIAALEDKRGVSQTTIHGTKVATWEHVCMLLRIVDVWLHFDLVRERDNLYFLHFDRHIEGMSL